MVSTRVSSLSGGSCVGQLQRTLPQLHAEFAERQSYAGEGRLLVQLTSDADISVREMNLLPEGSRWPLICLPRTVSMTISPNN